VLVEIERTTVGEDSKSANCCSTLGFSFNSGIFLSLDAQKLIMKLMIEIPIKE
jgi:hypothetical protein